MVRAYLGALGAGKSYSMVRDAMHMMRQGFDVYSLTDRVSFARVIDLDDVPGLIVRAADGYDAVLLVDEAGLRLFCREWARTDSALMRFLITSRKRGFHVLYTAQYRDMVDKVLREVTTDVVRLWRLGSIIIRYNVSDRSVEFYRLSDEIFRYYDTYSGLRGGTGRDFSSSVSIALERVMRSISARAGTRYYLDRFLSVESFYSGRSS